jgi:L,D-transpeptidase catalytic domain
MSPLPSRGLHLAKRGKYQAARGHHRVSKADSEEVADSKEVDGGHRPRKSPLRRWALRLGSGVGLLIVLAGIAAVVILFAGKPHVSVASSDQDLFDVNMRGLGTHLSGLTATSSGRPVALVRQSGGVVPASKLAQNQSVTVTARATPPSWLRWLLGSGVSSSTTVRVEAAAPSVTVALTSHPGQVPVSFNHPVSVVAYHSVGQPTRLLRLSHPAKVATLVVPSHVAAGSLQVVAAPHPWEKLPSRPSLITWFSPPADGEPVALAEPAPGTATAASNGRISLTFDQPVAQALGGKRPTLSPNIPGSWSEPRADTLVFTPQGFGFGPGTAVTVGFGRPVAAVGPASAGKAGANTISTASSYSFSVAPGSMLRVEQVLAQLHYLPLNFVPARGTVVPKTFAAEVASMSDPPAGKFTWRWASTPATLQSQWTVGSTNVLVQGALMAFESVEGTYNAYQMDAESAAQIADASTWNALLHAAAANQLDPNPYSYVYVTQTLPETLTLWQNGSVVLTSPANTGISARPTAVGTYPIYLRFSFNYMSGFNPDGSPYHDPVYWINYFNGGDAVHGFYRGSYGWPQSLGCVELPVSTAQTAYNDLAIGDLVTVS